MRRPRTAYSFRSLIALQRLTTAIKRRHSPKPFATPTDVYYCYRLLLQREPDPEGRAYWQDRLTKHRTTVGSLVEAFVHTDEFLTAQFQQTLSLNRIETPKPLRNGRGFGYA